MSSIRVRFISDHKIGSSIIQWFSNSKFSHCEFGLKDGTWLGARIKGGVQDRAADYCNPTTEYIYDIPCTTVQYKKFLSIIKKAIGTKYAWKNIIGIAIRNKRIRSVNGFICSQFLIEVLTKVLGENKVLNSSLLYDGFLTPEEANLSPIFVGTLISKH